MITLDGSSLTLEGLKKIVYEGYQVEADEEGMLRVEESRRWVVELVSKKKTTYGINTGFGKLSDVRIDPEYTADLQYHLIVSHACGVGDPFSENVSRAMLVLRVNTLLKGISGVRPILIDLLIDCINNGIHPVIPSQGSLGASGDLAPLSHLALVLLGKGEVFYKGKRCVTLTAFEECGMTPLELQAKEGLALINGTGAMTAVGAITWIESEELFSQADRIASTTLEALEGIIDAFDHRIHEARGYKEQSMVAERVRDYVKDSRLMTRQGEKRVQDAYSLRCIPQVHGASWQILSYVKEKLEIEMNAATDNPLLFSQDHIFSGGNFHGQPIAVAMDFLKIGLCEMANISERRTERLVNPQLNDLPPFLSPEPGLQSGAMILQYVAASLVSENKTLAHPASVDSIPSSGNQEDHVSMGTTAARHAYMILQNDRRVLAIESLCNLQAIEYRGIEKASTSTKRWHRLVRKEISSITKDREFAPDIEKMNTILQKGRGGEENE
ncbi:histidine ammonia-lyase [Bacillus coahuilensis p1.1.43]|uniref:Histidine ammonia-lyase n=1 Tax=Bacillus coahuilensis p1.1.43 TaxID=1150625 RepID=A0A147KBK0_9BACI|nr:histidine ammonia-lyase [Bacillus coahuilensis]KUP08492.1 histidine ammonia-lyase [Bacillus coahuilensis p1.1.43]